MNLPEAVVSMVREIAEFLDRHPGGSRPNAERIHFHLVPEGEGWRHEWKELALGEFCDECPIEGGFWGNFSLFPRTPQELSLELISDMDARFGDDWWRALPREE